MTTTAEIITDAFRQGNLVAAGAEPTTTESAEALRYLNRLVASVFGNEVGEPLTAFPLGQYNISRPSGFPVWGDDPSGDWFVPINTRLILNLNSAVDVYLHPMPCDGARFAANDIAGNLSTNTLTVHGNGRLFEGAASVTLDTDSLEQEWLFRADTGNWTLVSPLTTGDTFPFPTEFDDYFITLLAMRLNPSYGTTLDPQSQEILKRSGKQIRARYTQTKPVSPQDGSWRLTGPRKFYVRNQPLFGDNPGIIWSGYRSV